MAVSAKDSKLLEQKELISQLNTTIAAQTELILSLKKDNDADREQIQNLLAQVDYLTKKLFGTSSEKMKDVEGQLNLFDEAEQKLILILRHLLLRFLSIHAGKNVLLRNFLKEFHLGMRLFHFLKVRESVMSVVLPLNL